MIYITRKESFSAAHKLSRPDWTEAKNNEVFGKCSNPNWHGHNYTLWVTVKGEVNPDTGFVVNFMLGKLSSTEVLAIEFWMQIVNPINSLGCELHSVKIQETEKNFVEYFGV